MLFLGEFAKGLPFPIVAGLALVVGSAWITKEYYALPDYGQALRHWLFQTILVICCVGIAIFYLAYRPPVPVTWKGNQLIWINALPSCVVKRWQDEEKLGESIRVETDEHQADVGFKIPNGFLGRKCRVKFGVTVNEGKCWLVLDKFRYAPLETSPEVTQLKDTTQALLGEWFIGDESDLYAVIRVGGKSKVRIHYGRIELDHSGASDGKMDLGLCW